MISSANEDGLKGFNVVPEMTDTASNEHTMSEGSAQGYLCLYFTILCLIPSNIK